MISNAPFSRRRLILGGGVLLFSQSLRPRPASASNEVRSAAAPARASLFGSDGPSTGVWAYNGVLPGPAVRLRQGEPARIVVDNRLPEDTTVHWHGIRLPNAMDGVPGLTQPPIKPSHTFAYEFTPPDAGTFWYHPHADTLQQIGRGLSGPLIVEEPTPIAVDRDLLWFIADWQLTSRAEIAAGFPNPMQAAMAGRIGNVVTLNGRAHGEESVRAGERVRLRLVNGAVARIMALRFQGHRPLIVALDGQPCDPHEPEGGQILLGPAMRADVILDMQGEAGRRYPVVDDFYGRNAYELTALAYHKQAAARGHAADQPPALPRNPMREPDIARAERHEFVLEGGMMGGHGMMMGAMGGHGMMMGTMGGHGMMMGTMGGSRAAWSINGLSMTGDGGPNMPPALTLRQGRSVVFRLRNDTAWWHPMHLHGHSFRLLTRNGHAVPNRQWRDTVLLAPDDTVELAFVADNPGNWMFHCHIVDHQMTGLMTVVRVA